MDFAAYFLPRRKRDAIHVARAFALLIRDALKESKPGGCCSDAAGIAPVVRSRVDALYDGTLDLPRAEFRDPSQQTLAAMGELVRQFDVPRSHWHEFIYGLVADAGVVRYATWRTLEQHCEQTGGSLAAIASCILGLTHSDVGTLVRKLGVAARLTGILRDLPSDLSHGRIYLPLEDLARFRYSERELNDRVVNDRFRALIGFEVDRANQLLKEGGAVVRWLGGDGSRMAASVFVSVRAGMLAAIERNRFDIFAADLRVSTAQKFMRIPAAWKLARQAAAADVTAAG